METQVRVYRIKPGQLDAFVEEWREQMAPLRQRFGFEVVAAWASQEDDTFVWVLSHEGDFAAVDREYYMSPERAALDPDPARHILEPRAFRARPVPFP
jgi:NIPSNAP protein